MSKGTHARPSTRAAAAAAAVAACMTSAAAERLVMTKLGQLYLPFEMGEGGPRFCFDQGLAEQITYHAPTQQVIAASGEMLQVVDMTNASAPALVGTVETGGAAVTDIETCGGIAAASLENPDSAVLPGSVKIYEIMTGGLKEMAEVSVGALPDMITFTPDCSIILTANEGEAGEGPDGTFMNPEGSVSIISVDMALAGEDGAVRDAGFTKFNDMADELVAKGVRWIWRGQAFPDPSAFPEQTFSKDLEPEYIAVSKDGSVAYVALQENNAIAIVDIAAAEVTDIQPLTFKAWADIMATSDLVRGSSVNLQPWTHFGVFQPDAITLFSVDGKEYIALANEGDTKEYEITADVEWTEEADAPDIAGGVNATAPAFFAEPTVNTMPMTLADALAGVLEDLTVSTVDGGERGPDGEAVESFDKVVTFGGRSISILEILPDGTLAMVYDSGQELEARHHTHWPQLHNMDFPDGFCAPNDDIARQLAEAEDPEALFLEIAESGKYEDFAEEDDGEIEVPDFVASNFAGEFDRRSARKGPETEGVEFAVIDGRPILFVANERASTVFMYDVSDPTKPVYQDSVYGGPIDSEMTFHQLYEARMIGEVDPESMAVISASDSPTGKTLLVIGGSLSGTIGVYEVTPEETPMGEPISSFPCEPATGGPKIVAMAPAVGVTLGDINPMADFPQSSPTEFMAHDPMPGTFAVPADADSAAADLSVPMYGTQSVLSGPDCRGRGESEICFDTPGLFSGLAGPMAWCKQPNSFGVFGLGSESDGTGCPFGNGSGLDQGLLFMGMTDRGPNQGCDDVSDFGIEVLAASLEVSGKGFPVPGFSPAMTFLELNAASGELELLKACPLQGVDGTAVTGVSADDSVDVPFTKDCAAPLDFEPFGMDTEEVQPIGKSGWCLLVEEFSPSVAVVRCDPRGADCGTVHTRYVPEGSPIPEGGAYEVIDSLPSELSFRIPNRGLETAVVSPDGKTAFAFMQSPLLDGDAAEPITNTTALRVLRLSIGDASDKMVPPTVTVDAMHVYSFDAFPLWDDADSNRRVLVLVAERSRGQVKLYDADFASAADLLSSSERNDDPAALTPELLYNDGAVPMDLAPAAKELLMDSSFVEGWEERGVSAKQEGVALVNSCVVVLAADNDFGLESQPVSSVTFVQLDRCLPSYGGAIYDSCA